MRTDRDHCCITCTSQDSKQGKNYSIRCTLPQSGQIQVGPLEIPHLFSAKHSGQISNPQVQLQQKGLLSLQQ